MPVCYMLPLEYCFCDLYKYIRHVQKRFTSNFDRLPREIERLHRDREALKVDKGQAKLEIEKLQHQ